MPILPQSPVAKQSVAFQFGQEDAQQGKLCCPEMVFIQRQQQVEYCQGYESVAGVTATTAQFTGSVVPVAVMVPNYSRSNGREYTRRTDHCADTMLKLAERHARHVEEMIAKTAAEFPWAAGDILLA